MKKRFGMIISICLIGTLVGYGSTESEPLSSSIDNSQTEQGKMLWKML